MECRTSGALLRPFRVLLLAVICLNANALDHQSAGETVASTTKEPVNQSLSTRLHVNTNLVLIPVTVTDKYGNAVADLQRDDFTIYDSDQQQEIRYFSCEDTSISLGIILDSSGSMGDKIAVAEAAVREFLHQANSQDEFFLITVKARPELVKDFTISPEALQDTLLTIMSRGKTALLDAIYMGIQKMQKARYKRKALLIISDGGDNSSRFTFRELKALVEESDVQLYAVGLYDFTFSTPEERWGPRVMDAITDTTGGHTYLAETPAALSKASREIGQALRNQCVLGYYVDNLPTNGKWRKLKVKLTDPKTRRKLTVRTRTGYYVPGYR